MTEFVRFGLNLLNLFVLLLSLSNLSFNNFVFPETRFYNTQIWIWDFGYKLLVYYPVCIPLIFYSYRDRFDPVKNIKILFVYLFLSLLTNVPASYILLDGSPGFYNFLFLWVIFGISLPFAVVLLCIGLAKTGSGLKLTWPFVFFVLILLFSVRVIFTGGAMAKLEDEVAYFLQALIFESGQIKIQISEIPGLSAKSISEIYHMPYIFSRDGYYSVHLHAWSFLLSLAGFIKPWINYIVFIFSIPVFIYGNRVIRFFPENWEVFAALLFASVPVLFFQTNSYMAHTSTMLLHMSVFIAWFAIKEKKNKIKQIIISLSFVLLIVLVLIWRPQAAIPLLAGLLIVDLYFIFLNKSANILYICRIFFIGLGGVIAFVVLRSYADRMDSNYIFFTADYFSYIFGTDCQSLGFGQGHGCFPTSGTAGYSFRKVIIRLFELFSMGNQELNAFGLPILSVIIYLIFVHRYQIFKKDSVLLPLTLISILHVGVFSLYFHNGGENYRGRYLSEISYILHYSFLYLLYLESKNEKSKIKMLSDLFKNLEFRSIAMIIFLCLLCLQFTRSRGNFIQTGVPTYLELPLFNGNKISNALVYAKEDLPFTEKLTSNGLWAFPDEFSDDDKYFTRTQIKAAFNTGLSTMVSHSVRIDQYGLMRDKNGNVLTGEIPIKQLMLIHNSLKLKGIYELSHTKPKVVKIKRNLKKVILPDLIIRKIY